MRVFGYSRVSTAEQADEGVSLAAQQQQIAGYAMKKGWTVAEHFVERGVSGSLPLANRPEGARLLATIGIPRQVLGNSTTKWARWPGV